MPLRAGRQYSDMGDGTANVVIDAYAIQERAVSENPASGPDGAGWKHEQAYTLEARSTTQIVANAITASAGHHGHSSPRGDGYDNLIVGALDSECGSGKLTIQGAANGQQVPVGRYWDGSDVAATLDVSALVKRQTMPEKGRFSAVTQAGAVRRLTPVECALLQGFPATWHDIEWSHANADEADSREILRCLWRSTYTWAREGWGHSEPPALLTPEILLAGVYGGWVSWEVAGECAATRRALPGADAWTEGFVRGLREAGAHRSSPHRRESFEQFAHELGGPLSGLPLEEAQAAALVLDPRVWAEASQEWPVRHARPAQETRNPLADSHRYRQLGNAVCTNVAEWIARRIVAAGGES